MERRTLTIEETLDGTLGYTGETQVLNGLAGTLTRLPELGAIVERGTSSTRSTASGGPSCCTGLGRRGGPSSPACRTAPTCKQLEENLKALGFTRKGFDVDREWDGATTARRQALADERTG